MKKPQNSLLLSLLLCTGVLQAEKTPEQHSPHAVKIKARVSAISGSGLDYIARGEGWIKYTPAYLDLQGRVENKNGNGFQKYRVQFMPLKYKNSEWGLAARYMKKEGQESAHGFGFAFRVWGEHWKVPFRYYPDLQLIHSKPQIKYGKLRADCQIIDYHTRKVWTLRPGVDWMLTKHFSVGMEGRAYSQSEKNYFGIRLRWMDKWMF